MKNIIFYVITLLFLFNLCACGGEYGQEDNFTIDPNSYSFRNTRPYIDPNNDPNVFYPIR